MSQRDWLNDKHQKNLAKLASAGSVDERVVVCADAASEFQRATVAWNRTFELIHEWVARTRDHLSKSPSVENLEAYASSAKGLVNKAVFYDLRVAKPNESSKRGMATVDIALELVELAQRHPGSWQIVRAGADAMANLMLGSLECNYRLEFEPFERLHEIARVQLESEVPDSHVVRVYLDAMAERLGRSLRRNDATVFHDWNELRTLVAEIDDTQIVGGPYCKAVAALVQAREFPDIDWLDREVELVSGWWFGAKAWVGGRAALYPDFGRLLHHAVRAAPDAATRDRYQELYDQYVETLPNWE